MLIPASKYYYGALTTKVWAFYARYMTDLSSSVKKNPKNYLKSPAMIVKYKISLTLNMFLVNVNLEVNRAIIIIKT